MRRTLARRGVGILALAALWACLLHPAAVWAADGTAGATARRIADGSFDVLFLRTTGLAVLGVGVMLFVPAVIVSSPGGKTPIVEAWDEFIVKPTEYAITRPLGDF